MADFPRRVQLRRAKGWRMPENTVKVDRTTPWGNPFIVGTHGTRAECVKLFTCLMGGLLCVSQGTELADAQVDYINHAEKHLAELKGRNLACWCPLDAPCHADVLLLAANRPTVRTDPLRPIDLEVTVKELRPI